MSKTDYITHKAFTQKYLESIKGSKKDLFHAMALTPKTTVDYALPQQWLDHFVKITGLDYYLVLGTTFYAYPDIPAGRHGFPISGCIEVNQQIDKWVIDRPVKVEKVKEVIKQPYREHHCWECKHSWLAEVKYNDSTNNLSGERSEYCPKCNIKSSCASPWLNADGSDWSF